MKIALIAKAIILNTKNEILIAQKSATKRFGPNQWTTPAGHIEKGETPEQAVLREVKEEVGLDVTILTNLGLDKRDSPEIADKQIHSHYFLCRTQSTSVTLQVAELQKYEWITIKQAQNDKRLTTPVKEMCQQVIEFL